MLFSHDTLTETLRRYPGAVSWIMVGFFSAWGGLVRYLMDSQEHKKKRN